MRIVAAIVIACATCANAQPSEPLLDAIRQVESGGRDLTGDGGRAIGPYQIHRRYWQDAVRLDPSLGGTYNDCRNEQYARRVVRVYLLTTARARATRIWPASTMADQQATASVRRWATGPRFAACWEFEEPTNEP